MMALITQRIVRNKHLAIAILLALQASHGVADTKLGTREVLLENDTVEVVRLTYPVGSESGMHTHIHPSRAVYFVKGGRIELIPLDEQKPGIVIDAPDGKVLFVQATTHNVKNVGDTEVILIETEIKQD
jgi:mannose-6-phosphate isomerase-like protein (cupin superfamily)